MNSSEWPGEAHVDNRWGELHNTRADILLDQHSDVVIVSFGLLLSVYLRLESQKLSTEPLRQKYFMGSCGRVHHSKS